jgi:Tol biopolymer transport system component/DNA-binding winged helix-turn-helix (wHTH) protein
MSSPAPHGVITSASAQGTGAVYEFRDFRVDCGRFELSRNGQPLRIERKPLELLILLVSREGQLVTRPEIAERLWSSKVFVDTEHGINTAIRKLRYLLRDDPDNPHFIQTVTGMGYRFIAHVSGVAPLLPPEDLAEPASPVPPLTILSPRRRALVWSAAAAVVCIALVLFSFTPYRSSHRPPEVRFTQLTNFTDSAVAPALSPDGHMVAFIRGNDGFLTSDQIYVKLLPNGEASRVTDDPRPKYGLAFSPDGAEIAYTVLDGSKFATWEVSALGGEPHLLLDNAAGLVWLDPEHLLFSRVPTGQGIHLSVVTSSTTGAGVRNIYAPAHQRGMAHYSFPSPDRRWDLVVEMNGDGDWAPCRLVALESRTTPRVVGPTGACTSGGWSPDGRRMYFTAEVKGQSHIWRQRFPDGIPEQLTFGPTEEDGLTVEPEGLALITSVGVHESAIWIHDSTGERPLSSEGEVVGGPVFSPDTTILYYLLRPEEDSSTELWRTEVSAGKSEAVFPGISMTAFDLSPDGKRVVYTTAAPDGGTQLWVAAIDRSSPATKVDLTGARWPHFGEHGQILFQHPESNANYLEQINPDGSHRSRVLPYPIEDFMGISPSRRWVVASAPGMPHQNLPAVMAIPLDGGTPRRICVSYCFPRWSTDGRFLFVPLEESSRTSPGRSLAIPLGPGESLPDFPEQGIPAGAQPDVIHGAHSVPRGDLVPSKDAAYYAWVNTTVQRNLYRISLP